MVVLAVFRQRFEEPHYRYTFERPKWINSYSYPPTLCGCGGGLSQSWSRNGGSGLRASRELNQRGQKITHFRCCWCTEVLGMGNYRVETKVPPCELSLCYSGWECSVSQWIAGRFFASKFLSLLFLRLHFCSTVADQVFRLEIVQHVLLTQIFR